MIRGFLSGVFWGGMLSVIVLGAVSLSVPLPDRRAPMPMADDGSAALPGPTPPAVEPQPQPAEPPAPRPLAAAESASQVAQTGTGGGAPVQDDAVSGGQPAEAEVRATVEIGALAPAAAVPAEAPSAIAPAAETAVTTATAAAGIAPAQPDAAGPVMATPEAPGAAAAPTPGPAPVADAAQMGQLADEGASPATAEAPAAPGPVLAEPAPQQPGGLAAAPALVPEPTPTPPPAAEVVPAPAPDATPDAPPAEALPPRPQPGFAAAVEGVRTGRLPRIGAAQPDPAAGTPAAGLPETTLEAASASALALERNARGFANPEGKPPFAVLLIDTGDAAVDLAALAAGDLPVTLVVDPSRPGAAERAALWRAAGQEVALLTTGIPARGRAADIEVAMEALVTRFPQALALVDPGIGGIQGDRALASVLVPALAARGFGLVTWDRGLNAADQVARRDGLAAAKIFRELDPEGESAPVIRRYLDRAAFKAQQDGKAMVIGRLRPETVAGLLDWSKDARAGSLALAPLSGLLLAP